MPGQAQAPRGQGGAGCRVAVQGRQVQVVHLEVQRAGGLERGRAARGVDAAAPVPPQVQVHVAPPRGIHAELPHGQGDLVQGQVHGAPGHQVPERHGLVLHAQFVQIEGEGLVLLRLGGHAGGGHAHEVDAAGGVALNLEPAVAHGQRGHADLGFQEIGFQALEPHLGQVHGRSGNAGLSQGEVVQPRLAPVEAHSVAAFAPLELVVGLQPQGAREQLHPGLVAVVGGVLRQVEAADEEAALAAQGLHEEVAAPPEGLAPFGAPREGVGVVVVGLQAEVVQVEAEGAQGGGEGRGRGPVREVHPGAHHGELVDADVRKGPGGLGGLRGRRQQVLERGVARFVQHHLGVEALQADLLEDRGQAEHGRGAQVHVEPVPGQQVRAVLVLHPEPVEGDRQGEGIDPHPGHRHLPVEGRRQAPGQLRPDQGGGQEEPHRRIEDDQESEDLDPPPPKDLADQCRCVHGPSLALFRPAISSRSGHLYQKSRRV